MFLLLILSHRMSSRFLFHVYDLCLKLCSVRLQSNMKCSFMFYLSYFYPFIVGFRWRSCCLIFSFFFHFGNYIVCPYSFGTSDYTFDIFKMIFMTCFPILYLMTGQIYNSKLVIAKTKESGILQILHYVSFGGINYNENNTFTVFMVCCCNEKKV